MPFLVRKSHENGMPSQVETVGPRAHFSWDILQGVTCTACPCISLHALAPGPSPAPRQGSVVNKISCSQVKSSTRADAINVPLKSRFISRTVKEIYLHAIIWLLPKKEDAEKDEANQNYCNGIIPITTGHRSGITHSTEAE